MVSLLIGFTLYVHLAKPVMKRQYSKELSCNKDFSPCTALPSRQADYRHEVSRKKRISVSGREVYHKIWQVTFK